MTLPLTLIALAALAQVPTTTAEPGPLRIMWDLQPDPSQEPFLDWLQGRGWCWGIEVPGNAPMADFDRVTSRGMKAVAQLHAHPETRAWHWERRKSEVPDLAGVVEKARKAGGCRPIMQMFMEDDSAGVGFSARLLREKPQCYSAVKDMWDCYLEEAMEQVRPYPDLTVWGMAGFARSAHDYMRHGVNCVIIERSNDDIEDLQTAVAFARGAARQYGKEWGIDLSLWWGVFYGCVPDLNASLYTRHLWLSFLAGAQAYRIEGGGMHFGPAGPGEVCKAVDAFGNIAKDLGRGVVDTPVAVMLAPDHGWMTPAYWRTQNEAWNYARLPYRQGDRGIDGFFGAAYPGSVYAMDPFPLGAYKVDDPLATPFALSCITEEFAPRPEDKVNAEPPIPFGKYRSRNDAREDFLKNKADPSPYRPMGDSHWGDIFDVLTSDASQDVMDRYKVIVLLGQQDFTHGLKARLKAFADQGGTVVWSAGQAAPKDSALCGAAIQPELRVGRAWTWKGAAAEAEAFRYCPAVDMAQGVEALVKTPAGDPLALRNPVGKGAVVTCLVPWFEAGHTPLSRVASRLFEEVFDAVQPVKIEGLPVQWLSTTGRGHRTLLVTNNDGNEWSGTATVRNVDTTLTQCRDIITGDEIAFERKDASVVVKLTVPAYGVRVVRWGK